MVRTIAGIALGIVGWFAVVLGVSVALRMLAPSLAGELNAHATTGALAGRLAISFAGSVIGGAAAGSVGGRRASLIAGVILLLLWGSYHVLVIWHQFPLWYHLTFFVSLLLLSVIGGRLAGRRVR